jgi:hypothetical protein
VKIEVTVHSEPVAGARFVQPAAEQRVISYQVGNASDRREIAYEEIGVDQLK